MVVEEIEGVVYEVPVYSSVPPDDAEYHFTPLPPEPVVAVNVTAPVPHREAPVGEVTVPGTAFTVTEDVEALPELQHVE